MERRAIAISGTVQGVGFRPFVHGLAARLELDGFVKNQAGGVRIEVEGEPEPLDHFMSQLVDRSPPLARIEELSWQRCTPIGRRGFVIQPSDTGATGPIAISPDIATCDQCLEELFDPANRRYRYPFINCTNCGPRLTIISGSPYDRPRTTMAGFEMCPACRMEYEDPSDRRFHAQPVCCAVCGPRLELLDGNGQIVRVANPLISFRDAIRAGQIGAIKGLGGYHLVCDAENPAAMAELRKRKHRDEKPFAIMTDLESAERLCEIAPEERALLTSPCRPIVLLRRRRGGAAAVEAGCENKIAFGLIAPGNPWIGVMLPYTPLHHLLLHDMGRPLVMTSGNRSDEPIAYREPEAMDQLRGIADLFLTHNRPIHVRCDDSVTRVIGKIESPIRRSRGYAPQPASLPIPCPAPILAVGAQLKGTFALGKDRRAIISHHMGDLDHFSAYRAFERDIELYEKLFAITPEYIAHDLHPDYASTRYAVKRSPSAGAGIIAVQHHQAHIASCMVENGLTEPVIGVAFDGTGYGLDGAIWGGEFFVGNLGGFKRAAHLRYIPLPGGDSAVREPWRVAAAYLVDAGAECEMFECRQNPESLRTVRSMIEKKFNSPMTSSVGRLFDAVASLCGARDKVSYEGQAAMQLEWLASDEPSGAAYPYNVAVSSVPESLAISATPLLQINTRPLIRAIVNDVNGGISASRIARRFHTTLAGLAADVCVHLHKITGINAVALSGGVFMNKLLSMELQQRLATSGLSVYRHQKVPPNDGGLCLGQLAMAASQIRK